MSSYCAIQAQWLLFLSLLHNLNDFEMILIAFEVFAFQVRQIEDNTFVYICQPIN